MKEGPLFFTSIPCFLEVIVVILQHIMMKLITIRGEMLENCKLYYLKFFLSKNTLD